MLVIAGRLASAHTLQPGAVPSLLSLPHPRGYNSKLLVAQNSGALLMQIQAALGVDVNTLTTDQQLRDAFQQSRQPMRSPLRASH